MELIRGQKIKLSDVVASLEFEVEITMEANASVLDISCFGLDANGKLSDDRYFIFYNQQRSPCGSLTIGGARQNGRETFKINLGILPKSIQRLVFTVTLDGAGNMSNLGKGEFKLKYGNSECLGFYFSGRDFGSEKALMIAELYKKDVWRVWANGQGFNGGLSALLKSFGGEEALPAATPPLEQRKATPTPPPEPSKVRLSKIQLDKRGDTQKIDLTKRASTKPIHVNLRWNPNPQGQRGFLGLTSSGNVDLDLGCIYRLKNRNMGVIQPLGGNFGARDREPFILLDKDDRSGAATDGENLYIYRPEQVELMVIFAMIYEGTAQFSAVNGVVTIEDGTREIVVPLNNTDNGMRFCAVARVDADGESIRVTKDEHYFKDHEKCDCHYGFGFQWRNARK